MKKVDREILKEMQKGLLGLAERLPPEPTSDEVMWNKIRSALQKLFVSYAVGLESILDDYPEDKQS